MARVYLKGLPQLKAKLKKLQEDTADDVRPALGAGAQKIVDMMRRLVPKKTGALSKSIGWNFGAAPKGSISVASASAGRVSVTIYAGGGEAFYARWVEFGTAPHTVGGQFAGAEHPGSKAQPFFFPSYRALKKEVQRMLRKAVRDAVRKAVR